jgi:hypothetical protein
MNDAEWRDVEEWKERRDQQTKTTERRKNTFLVLDLIGCLKYVPGT